MVGKTEREKNQFLKDFAFSIGVLKAPQGIGGLATQTADMVLVVPAACHPGSMASWGI